MDKVTSKMTKKERTKLVNAEYRKVCYKAMKLNEEIDGLNVLLYYSGHVDMLSVTVNSDKKKPDGYFFRVWAMDTWLHCSFQPNALEILQAINKRLDLYGSGKLKLPQHF